MGARFLGKQWATNCGDSKQTEEVQLIKIHCWFAEREHHRRHKIRKLNFTVRNFILIGRQQPDPEINARGTEPRRVKQGFPQHWGADLETRQIDSQEHHLKRQIIRISIKQFLPYHHRQLRLLRCQSTLLSEKERLRAQLYWWVLVSSFVYCHLSKSVQVLTVALWE